MTHDTVVTLIGMPSTGKSTYLAALYDELSRATADAPVRLRRQPTQRAYLEALRAAWLAGKPVGRTSHDNGELVTLDTAFGLEEVRLTLPDIAGESFRYIIERREANTRIIELVHEATGVLLFTHPDHQRPRVLISEAEKVAVALGETLMPGPPRDFDPLRVPAEVHLVDLLQWAATVRPVQRPTRLAIMVSAWDRCGEATPSDWLTAKMPMLTSYLRGHGDEFPSTVWGVSAQGGDYEMDTGVADMRPYERAYVVGPEGERSNELSEPLRWAAEE